MPCVIGAMWQDPTDGVDFRLNTSKTIYHLGDINLGGGGVPGPQVSVLTNGNGGVPYPVDGASVVAAQGSPVSFS